jgi:hypothetical protein
MRAAGSWADPLGCLYCSGGMKLIAFIQPPQDDLIESRRAGIAAL